MVRAPERDPLTSDIDVDVCVVGGGLAGLTTARELARRGWSVAVLEAQRVAWNASGRNSGFVLPGFAQSMDVVVKRVGLDHARALWKLSEAGLEAVRATIRDTGMPGVEVLPGWLRVSKVENAEADLALVRLIGQELGGEVEGWPVERVRSALRTDRYFHGIHFPNAFHIHPLNYALGLAEAAAAAGAHIFEDTPVRSIDTEGVRKHLTTPSGRVRAGYVVLAGNVHLDNLVPRVAGTLLPVWTYVATTAPLGPRVERAIAFRGGVSDTDLADNHYRIVGGDRLMWSGRATTWEVDPKRFIAGLKAEIERIYPLLSGVEIDHIWSGVIGNPLHRMPLIGEVAPRVWMASGFSSQGINTTAMAADLIARAISEGDDDWRLFLPFELVWAGGAIGRAATQVHYWWHRAREQAVIRAARQRGAERRNSSRREPERVPANLSEAPEQLASEEPSTAR